MQRTAFMTVAEVAETLGISKSHAYKIVHQLNQELKNKGFITIAGRINRRYFNEKVCYGGSDSNYEHREVN